MKHYGVIIPIDVSSTTRVSAIKGTSSAENSGR